MRKVLSIVLVLALVLGSTAFTFGAVPSDVSGTKYEDAVNVLMELDVISGYPDGSYKPAGIVTRGEMAKIIICALGLEDYAAGASSFKDMAGHWSDKYVAYAVSLGIINGYPDGTFKPDNTVTYDEAAKMLVAALGYTEEALVGTWPANWVTKAKTLGILDGIKNIGSAGANRGDIAIMAFQTLNQAVGKVNKDGEFAYDKDGAGNPKDTMLLRLGAGDYTTAMNGLVAADGTFIVLGNEDSIINLKPYLGSFVTAYANSDEEIIAIKEVKSVYLEGEFNAAGLATGQTFETDNVDYAVTVSGIEQYFTNGEIDAGFAVAGTAAATKYTITAKVSGKKISEVYSVQQWDVIVAGGDDQVSEIDLKKMDAKAPTLLGSAFPLDNNDEIDYKEFELIGVDSLSDIKEDHICYVLLFNGEMWLFTAVIYTTFQRYTHNHEITTRRTAAI